jgi:hypothetical protein
LIGSAHAASKIIKSSGTDFENVIDRGKSCQRGIRVAMFGASMSKTDPAIQTQSIENRIHEIRGFRVILDKDLAELYSINVKRLNEQVRRNIERFPEDFMFQLRFQEVSNLRSQIATSSLQVHETIDKSEKRYGGRRYLPYAFTEYGAIMAANVLNSPIAVQASIKVVRTFVHMREMVVSHKELSQRLAELEKKYDAQFKVVFSAIRKLMEPPVANPRRIGFES